MTPLSFQDFSASVDRAESYWRAGDWNRARDTYSELLGRRLAEGGSLAENELLVAERLADLAAPFGDFAEADKLYAAVAGARSTGNDWARSDTLVFKRVHLALAADNLEKAAELLREAEPRSGPLEDIEFTEPGLQAWEVRVDWRGPHRPLALAHFYLVSGRTLGGWGQFGAAEAAFRRGLSHCAPDAELARLAETPLRLALAATLLEKGDFGAAQIELDAVQARIDPSREPGYAASSWETSAKIRMLHGDFTGAEARLQEVLELCRRSGLAAGSATSATNLAELLVVLNRVHEAMELLDEASSIAASLSNSNPAIAQRIARVRFVGRCRAGGAFDGEPLALPVLAMQAGSAMEDRPAHFEAEVPFSRERPASYLAFYESRELEFLAHVHSRKLDEAESGLRWMQADFAGTGSLLVALRMHVLGAVLAYQRGRYAEAEILLSTSSEKFQGMGALPDLYQCRRIQALCWDKLGYLAARRAALREANDALLERLAAPLGQEAREVYLLNKWRQRELLLGQEVDRLSRLQSDHTAAKGWMRLVSRWRLLRQAAALIQRIDTTDARKGAGLWTRLACHSWGTRTIGFLVLPNSTFTYSIGWLSLSYRVGASTRVGLRSLVKSFQSNITALDPRSQSAASHAAAKLAEALRLPELLRELPGRVRHLTFVPDDQLHGFPFAAIPVGPSHQPNACLGLRWTTSIAMAGGGRSGRSRIRTAVIAGAGNATGYPPLPAVANQCHGLAQWMEHRGMDARVLMDHRLTRHALFESLASADLLHFSGHGTLRPDAPENSGLVLPEADAEGQVVRLVDLVAHPMNRLRHATLAACWSADGYAFPGGYHVSFPQLLGKAGVGSVLAPLWEVEDRVLSDFLKTFYAALATSPRAEALRQAQQYVIGRGYASPYWWAAFQLYGEAGRLRV